MAKRDYFKDRVTPGAAKQGTAEEVGDRESLGLKKPLVLPNTETIKATSGEPDYDGALAETAAPSDSLSDYLKGMSAKDLLDANVMTQISNEIARKNLQSDLSNMGLANSGYAGTASALIGNATQGQMAQNQRAYNEAIMQADKEAYDRQQTALATEADNISANISQLSQDARTEYLTGRGLVQDENGRWINGKNTNYSDTMLNGINDAFILANNASANQPNEVNAQNMQDFDSMFSGMNADQREDYLSNTLGLKFENGKWVNGDNTSFTEAQLAHINNAYKYTNAIDEQDSEANKAIDLNNSIDDLLKQITISGNKPADDSYWGIKNELADFINTFKDNPPPEGYVVTLSNGRSDNHAVLVYRNGQWVQGTDADWQAADNSYKRLFKEGI